MRYTIVLIAAVLVSSSMIAQTNTTVTAQVVITPGSNIPSQPLWGPVGYEQARYYYLPEIETYYDVSQRQYYYNEGGRWIGSRQLPSRFSGFNLFESYKVVINESKPYQQHQKYKEQYSSMKGRHDQELIRESHDTRYHVIKGHPEHNRWTKRNGSEDGQKKANWRPERRKH